MESSTKSWRTCTAGDPKFWPPYIRHLTIANICFFVFLGNLYAAGLATGFVSLATEFHVPLPQLSDTISYPVLALGVGNLFWTPTAICFGKRPTILLSIALFLAFSVWSVYARTLNELIASRVLACFAAGSVESLGPSVIADLYMERYFATSMAFFSLSLAAGAQFGPMIAGYLITARGWRWFFILCSILIGVNLFMSLFLLPETNYKRIHWEGETAADADKVAAQELEHGAKGLEENVSSPIEGPTENAPYAGSYWADLVAFRNRGLENGFSAWAKQFSLPFRFALVPHVIYSAIIYGVFLGGLVMISTLMPQLLSPPPYHFSAAGIGLFTMGSFPGILIAYPLAGPLTDLISRMATKARGRHEPEHRMPALIMPFLICPAGVILFAYTMANHGSAYVAAVGVAMQTSALVFVPSVMLSVIVDAYPETSSEALVLINAGKNLVAFGITVSTPKWFVSEGLKNMFWEIAGIQWGLLALAVPVFFFGPWLRRKTMSLV